MKEKLLFQKNGKKYQPLVIAHVLGYNSLILGRIYKNIGVSWKEPDEIFKMEPTWHF